MPPAFIALLLAVAGVSWGQANDTNATDDAFVGADVAHATAILREACGTLVETDYPGSPETPYPTCLEPSVIRVEEGARAVLLTLTNEGDSEICVGLGEGGNATEGACEETAELSGACVDAGATAFAFPVAVSPNESVETCVPIEAATQTLVLPEIGVEIGEITTEAEEDAAPTPPEEEPVDGVVDEGGAPEEAVDGDDETPGPAAWAVVLMVAAVALSLRRRG